MISARIPGGRFVTAKETSPLEPFSRLIEMGTSMKLPTGTLAGSPGAASPKSGGDGASGVVIARSSKPTGPLAPVTALNSNEAMSNDMDVTLTCWLSGAPGLTVTVDVPRS